MPCSYEGRRMMTVRHAFSPATPFTEPIAREPQPLARPNPGKAKPHEKRATNRRSAQQAARASFGGGLWPWRSWVFLVCVVVHLDLRV